MSDREKLSAIMARLQWLRARPESHQRALVAVSDPKSSADDIAEAITRDIALTAHILKVANSAAFAPQSKVVSAKEAVCLIGSLRLKALVSTAWAFQLLDESKKVPGFNPTEECNHAINVAMLCLRLAEKAGCGGRLAEQAFTAGLLHDLGKVLMAANVPEVYAEVSNEAAARPLPRWRAELEILGFDHAAVGGNALEAWGVDAAIVEAVRWHHQPQFGPHDEINPLTLVYLANCRMRGYEADPISMDPHYIELWGAAS
jgi:putative nucleotidyltransferase with HDIG domain